MSNEHWYDTLFTYVWVFNVERGLSIFIRTGFNHGIMYDFGSSPEFSPTGFVEKHILPHIDTYDGSRIAQTIISHPHTDHISEIARLKEGRDSPFYSSIHTCPHDKEPENGVDERLDWRRVNNRSEDEEKIYRDLYAGRKLPLQTIQYRDNRSIPNLEYGLYYVRPPKVADIYPNDDQEYTNGTSLVLFLRHGSHTLLIPGDMPPDVMEYLLEEKAGCEKRFTVFDLRVSEKNKNWHRETCDQPSLQCCLQEHGMTILIAPHHGLESGYSKILYDSTKEGKPGLVIISEKRHTCATDGTIDARYQSQEGAIGMPVVVEGNAGNHYSFSTRNGHHLLIVFRGTGRFPHVYAEKDPEKLLDKQ